MIKKEHITNLLEALKDHKIISIQVYCNGIYVVQSGAYGDSVTFEHKIEPQWAAQAADAAALRFEKNDENSLCCANTDVIWIDDDPAIKYLFCLRGKDVKDVVYCNGDVILL